MKNKKPSYKTLDELLVRMERLFLSVVIGLVLPIALGLAGWWGSIPFVPENLILYFALGGVLVGILLDLIFLRRWTSSALSVSMGWPVAVFLFYSVCVFGFFMGVPILNFALGAIWGYYIGMRLRAGKLGKPAIQERARKSGVFASIVMAVACAAAMTIAFLDPYLEANIQGMFNLAQPIGRPLILALSAFGGVILVVLEYVITRKVVKFASFV